MEDKENKGGNSAKTYIRFSALGFQMLAIVLAAAWGGNYLDKRYEMLQYRPFTVVLILLSLAISMYWVIKELNND